MQSTQRPNAEWEPHLREQKKGLRIARGDRWVMKVAEQLPRSSLACQQTGGSVLWWGSKINQFPLDCVNADLSCIENSEFFQIEERQHRTREFSTTRSVHAAERNFGRSSGHASKDILCRVEYKCVSRIELDYKPVLAARPT